MTQDKNPQTSPYLPDHESLKAWLASFLLCSPDSHMVSQLAFTYQTYHLPKMKFQSTELSPIAIVGDDEFTKKRVAQVLEAWRLPIVVVTEQSDLLKVDYEIAITVPPWSSRTESYQDFIQYCISKTINDKGLYQIEGFGGWTLRWIYLATSVLQSEDVEILIRDAILETSVNGNKIVDLEFFGRAATRRFEPTSEERKLNIIDPISAWVHRLLFTPRFSRIGVLYASRETGYPPLYCTKFNEAIGCTGLVFVPLQKTEAFLECLFVTSFAVNEFSVSDRQRLKSILSARCVNYEQTRTALEKDEEYVPTFPTDLAVAKKLSITLDELIDFLSKHGIESPWKDNCVNAANIDGALVAITNWAMLSGDVLPVLDDYTKVIVKGESFVLSKVQSEVLAFLVSQGRKGVSLSEMSKHVKALKYEPLSLRELFSGDRGRMLMRHILRVEGKNRYAKWFASESLRPTGAAEFQCYISALDIVRGFSEPERPQ